MDVLKILVRANYKYVPSLDEILETSAVMRLRNQLLEAEYYHLAVEVRRATTVLKTFKTPNIWSFRLTTYGVKVWA